MFRSLQKVTFNCTKLRNFEVAHKHTDPKEKPSIYKGVKHTTVIRPIQRLMVLLPKDEAI